MSELIFRNGRLRSWADDTSRTVKVYDAAGALVSTTPYTAEQNAAADAAAAETAARTARESTRSLVKAIITDLQAEKTRCDVVIAKSNAQVTGADTKDVARAAKRIADAAIDLARFVQDA